MIFWIGFFIMFFNEGFVMMRHISPLAAAIREELIKDFGDTWQKIHSVLDYAWIVVIALGFALSPNKSFHLLVLITFWNAALSLIYVPMWLKNRRNL